MIYADSMTNGIGLFYAKPLEIPIHFIPIFIFL